MKIFNPKEWPLNIDNFQEFGINELNLLLDQFGVEKNIKQKDHLYKKFEPLVDRELCIYEWYSFTNIIKSNFSNISMKILLPHLYEEYFDFFPNIIKLISIAYTIPVSSVECERGFSKQNLIKTKCRNLLTASSLDLCMRAGLEGPDSKVFDFQKAWLIWKNEKKRYLEKN